MTSVPRTVLTMRFWSTAATAEQVPTGATGDSSTPTNCGGSKSHNRSSILAIKRRSVAAGATNLSSAQRLINDAGVASAALVLARSICRVRRSAGVSSNSRVRRAATDRWRHTRSTRAGLLVRHSPRLPHKQPARELLDPASGRGDLTQAAIQYACSILVV